MRCETFVLRLMVTLTLVGCSCDAGLSPPTDASTDSRAEASPDARNVDAASNEDAAVDSHIQDAAFDVAREDVVSVVDGHIEDARADAIEVAIDARIQAEDCQATGGFCWLYPQGTGIDWTDLDGTSFNDLWAVGKAGKLLHRTINGWRMVNSPTDEDLYDVLARSASDVWAVGDRSTILHYDGSTWSRVAFTANEDLKSIAVTDTSLWVGGDSVWRRAGTTWTSFPFAQGGNNPSGEISALLAFSDSDVWTGNEYGNVSRWNGSAWSYTDADFSSGNFGWYRVEKMWGTGPSDVWAISSRGKAQHFDGTRWIYAPFQIPVHPEYASAGDSAASNNVWLATQWGLSHYDGATYTDTPYADGQHSVEPKGLWTDGEHVVVVGRWGHIFERVNGSLVRVSGVDSPLAGGYGDAVAFDADHAFFCGASNHRFADGTFTSMPLVDTQYLQEFGRCWAASTTDLWLVGIGQEGDNIQRSNGQRFERVVLPQAILDLEHRWLDDVWGSSANDVYIVGQNFTLRWNGSAFSTLNRIAESVHGTAADDLWMVASEAISHFDGTTWTPHNAEHHWWTEVHAISRNEAWVGGESALVRHYLNGQWTYTPLPLPQGSAPFVSGFAGTLANDVWVAAGDYICRWNGSAWTRIARIGSAVSGLASAPDGSVFVVGGNAILRRR